MNMHLLFCSFLSILTEMARYYQGGEISVFNTERSHDKLQRMLPTGTHSLGKD